MPRTPHARLLGTAIAICLIVTTIAFVAQGESQVSPRHPPPVKAISAIERTIGPAPTATPLPATPAPTPEPTPPPTPLPTPVPTPDPTPPAEMPAPAPIAVATPTPAPAPPPPAPSANQNIALAQTLVQMVNQQRAQSGLPSVALNSQLTAAAQKYSDLQFQTDPYALNHYLDGSPGDRALREGYTGGVGEVLVTSPPSAQQILGLWLASPPHAQILMGSSFSEIGMGCHQGLYTAADGVVFEIASCAGELGVPY